MAIKEFHVFDFDGTLVDSSHRYRTIQNADGSERIDLDYWIQHEHLGVLDKPLPLFEKFQAMCADPEKFVLIATARIWDDASKFWAKVHGLNCHIISRRGRQDCRGGAELKIKGINKLLSLKQFKNVEIHVHEDNISYLKSLCDNYDAVGHYYPSKQGH